MNKAELKMLFEQMKPDELQKARMKHQLLHHQAMESKEERSPNRRFAWFAIPVAVLALIVILIFSLSFGKSASVYAIHVKLGEEGGFINLADQLKDRRDQGSTTVSYIESRPSLKFYIDGPDIAMIEITTVHEFITAKDWTETQHEKYWNIEYYQYFDEEQRRSIANFDLIYDKTLMMQFAEDFEEYDQIWYTWSARNLYKWAAEDNFSRFYGVGYLPDPDQLSEQEKLALAASEGSPVGHIQLDGYPDHLKEDLITIRITDRQGLVTTTYIHVEVSNNEIGQTVVTATLLDDKKDKVSIRHY